MKNNVKTKECEVCGSTSQVADFSIRENETYYLCKECFEDMEAEAHAIKSELMYK